MSLLELNLNRVKLIVEFGPPLPQLQVVFRLCNLLLAHEVAVLGGVSFTVRVVIFVAFVRLVVIESRLVR